MAEKLSQLQAEIVATYQQEMPAWYPADHPDIVWLLANGYMVPTEDFGKYELTEKGKSYKHEQDSPVVGLDASQKETFAGKPTGKESSPVQEASKDVKDANPSQPVKK